MKAGTDRPSKSLALAMSSGDIQTDPLEVQHLPQDVHSKGRGLSLYQALAKDPPSVADPSRRVRGVRDVARIGWMAQNPVTTTWSDDTSNNRNNNSMTNDE
jgi:hypothetical protein